MTTTSTLISNLQDEIAEQAGIIRKSFDREVQLRARVHELERIVRQQAESSASILNEKQQRLMELEAENEALRKPDYQEAWHALNERGVENLDIYDVIAAFDAARKGQ